MQSFRFKKHFLTFLIIFILLTTSFLSNVYATQETKTRISILEDSNKIQTNTNDKMYEPRNITPKNVSYHPSNDRFTLEWWYFEGIFDNGYNAIVNIILVSKGNIGICISHLNIFHLNDSEIYYANREISPISSFEGSEQFPDIQIKNQ